LGFVFYPKSPRHITAAKAADIIQHLTTPAIGVFVNQMGDVLEIAKTAGLKGVQLHGDETPEDCLLIKRSFSGLVIKAFRPETEKDIEVIGAYKDIVDYILIDAAAGAQYGGTGKAADRMLAVKAKSFGMPLILAGGLTAENIVDAARYVSPFAVDLSSGIETSPGIKDAAKLDALFKIAKGDNHEN
jgi:phosphoribosylanthranilate isomerase